MPSEKETLDLAYAIPAARDGSAWNTIYDGAWCIYDTYIYIYIFFYVCLCIYVYQDDVDKTLHVHIYIYIWLYVYMLGTVVVYSILLIH